MNPFLIDKVNIGIVGSRRRETVDDFVKVQLALKRLIYDLQSLKVTLISGGCPQGADHFAEGLALIYELPIIIHYPKVEEMDASKNRRFEYTRVAYARNELIARDSDVLIACVAGDRKGGTENTIKHFLGMGKKDLVLV